MHNKLQIIYAGRMLKEDRCLPLLTIKNDMVLHYCELQENVR